MGIDTTPTAGSGSRESDQTMTEEKYFKRRLRAAMRDGADIADDLADSDGVQLPPEYVGRMGLALFRSRMSLAFRESTIHDLPEDDGRGLY